MNPMRTVAKIVLISVALYFLIHMAFSLSVYTITILTTHFPDSGNALYLIFIISYWILAGLLLIYFLIIKADFLAGKIVVEEEQKEELKNIFWLPAAFKLVFVIGGIFLLYRSIPDIIWIISSLINIERYNVGSASDVMYSARAITWIVQLAIGIYLILGAPYFARWHVKKILESAKEETTVK